MQVVPVYDACLAAGWRLECRSDEELGRALASRGATLDKRESLSAVAV
jgi:hypothetical protein